eukprot:15482801-Alexandrium_andersonii.AAC.1
MCQHGPQPRWTVQDPQGPRGVRGAPRAARASVPVARTAALPILAKAVSVHWTGQIGGWNAEKRISG